MAHDPLCGGPQYADVVPEGERERVINLMCRCGLIEKVRKDERAKAEMHDYHIPAWTDGYQKGLAQRPTCIYDINRTLELVRSELAALMGLWPEEQGQAALARAIDTIEQMAVRP